MRQVFTSPRLENVEAVAKLMNEAGIEIKVSEGRSYKKVSRREFSYVQQKNDGSNQPAIWVIKSEDYKRARELLHGMGLIEAAQAPSYLPDALQFKQAPAMPQRQRIGRMRLILLFAVGAMACWTIAKMFLLR